MLTEEQKYVLGAYAMHTWSSLTPNEWANILNVPVEQLAG